MQRQVPRRSRVGIVRIILLALAALPCSLAAAPLHAAVKANGLFTDNMVLQRDIRVPVWGTADDGSHITVSIAGEKAETTASQGHWRVDLPKLKAGGPFTLTIEGTDGRIELKNVLVGDVWIASGQSNMEMGLHNCADGPATVAASANPQIRLFTVPRHGSPKPESNVSGNWSECGPKTSADFSGVAYYFGRALQRDQKVPIGLINCNVGGTPAERWMNKDAYDAIDELKDMRHNELGDLYNAMIHPLIPFGIRGAIWYQGEANDSRAWHYRTLFPAMIKNWRDEWKQGDFPFLFVQLAPYQAIKTEPTDSNWAELRDAQLHTMMTVPNSAMAVITDVGDEKDIHPKRKEPAGERLALAAEHLSYGDKREYSGPTFSELTVQGAEATVHFQHVGGGLVCKGKKLTGFTIAGSDRKFHNAEAAVVGDTVVVGCPDVPEPVAVRFGWNDYPVVNLWNKEGLPASPFRSDDFPLRTEPKRAAQK